MILDVATTPQRDNDCDEETTTTTTTNSSYKYLCLLSIREVVDHNQRQLIIDSRMRRRSTTTPLDRFHDLRSNTDYFREFDHLLTTVVRDFGRNIELTTFPCVTTGGDEHDEANSSLSSHESV